MAREGNVSGANERRAGRCGHGRPLRAPTQRGFPWPIRGVLRGFSRPPNLELCHAGPMPRVPGSNSRTNDPVGRLGHSDD